MVYFPSYQVSNRQIILQLSVNHLYSVQIVLYYTLRFGQQFSVGEGHKNGALTRLISEHRVTGLFFVHHERHSQRHDFHVEGPQKSELIRFREQAEGGGHALAEHLTTRRA